MISDSRLRKRYYSCRASCRRWTLSRALWKASCMIRTPQTTPSGACRQELRSLIAGEHRWLLIRTVSLCPRSWRRWSLTLTLWRVMMKAHQSLRVKIRGTTRMSPRKMQLRWWFLTREWCMIRRLFRNQHLNHHPRESIHQRWTDSRVETVIWWWIALAKTTQQGKIPTKRYRTLLVEGEQSMI